MKTSVVSLSSKRVIRRTALLIALLVAIVAMTVPFHSTLSSSLDRVRSEGVSHPKVLGNPDRQTTRFLSKSGDFRTATLTETIATFAADCTTPKTTFILGETVCAVVNGITETDRFVNWLDPNTQIAFSSPTIPDSNAHSYAYTPTVIGTWKATIADPSDSSIIPAVFDVVAPGPIVTYTSGCTTPQDDFALGNTVCARVTGGLVAARRIAWVGPGGFIRQLTSITSDPQTDSFSIPNTATSTLANGEEVTNVGTWRATVISSRGSLVDYATFYVSDTGNNVAQLSISKIAPNEGENISPGSATTFRIVVYNAGPNAAQNVVITDPLPAQTTFVSITPATGCTTPMVGSTGTVTCNISGLPRGGSASYDVSVDVDGSTAAGTIISNTASVTSDTTDSYPADNTFTYSVRVVDTGTATCTLTCPGNMTVTADTIQGGEPGAVVSFSAASVLGSCGAVTNSPASGTFFALGTHIITSTAESGDSCTFTVTVVDTAPPTISCPANQTVTAAPSATSATVSVGTPTTNPSTGVTVIGVRSDDPNCTDAEIDPGCTPVPLTDPYPIGTTTIKWTVIQANGQAASCVQSITVLENNCAGDTEAPTITLAPEFTNITVGTGPDPAVSKFCTVALDDELGQPEYSDNCSVSLQVTGIPPNNAFPVGTTTVTYTAIDGAGNTASVQQHVTVFDNTPPIIVAPPDTSYTCLSEVPAGAAAIALAHGDNPNLPNGGPPTDNCGAPVVMYSDSSTGAGSPSDPLIITRTYTATDTSPLHNSASAVQTITVIDPIPPTIVLNGANPQYVECHTSYAELGATANDNCGNFAATPSGTVDVNTPGTYTITYNATDWAGNAAQPVTRTVIVQDTIAPTITVTSVPQSLWPPNHKYQTFQVASLVTSATDSCDTNLGVNNVVIEGVTSDEVENGNGDGNTFNDIIIAADCKSVDLRAEREGAGDGRIYTITFKVADASGNIGRATLRIVVPRNVGQTPVDSGVHYTVLGSCP